MCVVVRNLDFILKNYIVVILCGTLPLGVLCTWYSVGASICVCNFYLFFSFVFMFWCWFCFYCYCNNVKHITTGENVKSTLLIAAIVLWSVLVTMYSFFFCITICFCIVLWMYKYTSIFLYGNACVCVCVCICVNCLIFCSSYSSFYLFHCFCRFDYKVSICLFVCLLLLLLVYQYYFVIGMLWVNVLCAHFQQQISSLAKTMNERTNEQTNEGMTERTNERTNERANEHI